MKKSTTYKIICIITAFSLAVFCFSCDFPMGNSIKDDAGSRDGYKADPVKNASDTPEESIGSVGPAAYDYLESLNVKTFGGSELRIAAFDDEYFLTSGLTDLIHSAVDERNALCESKLGIKIVGADVSHTSLNDYYEKLCAEYYANSDFCELVIMPYSLMDAFIAQNMLLNMNTLPFTDYTAPYYDHKAMASVTPGTFAYAAIGDYTYSPDKIWCVFYNKDLCAKLGLKDPSELFNSGAWNWDMVKTYSKTARDAGYYGFTTNTDDTTFCDVIWASSDITTIENEPPYPPVMNFKNDTTNSVMKLISSLIVDNNAFLSESRRGDKEGADYFKQGRCLFYIYKASAVSFLDSYDFTAGALPMPKCYSDQAEYSGYVDRSTQAVFVLNNCMNTDLAGSALQVLSAASYGKLSDVFMKICMNYYLPDNDSALIMKQIISNAYYDAGYMLGGKALKEFGDASFEMIRSKVLFNLDFNELYKANITAFNERYSVRNLFVIKRQ